MFDPIQRFSIFGSDRAREIERAQIERPNHGTDESANVGAGLPPGSFITAYGDRRTEQQVRQADAIGLLRKPFSDDALIDALSSALGV